MKTIELLNKKYEYPTSWRDVSVMHYQKIHSVIEKQKEEDDDEDILKSINNQIEVISMYTNIPVDVLKKEEPKKMVEFMQDLQFLKEEIPSKQINEFTFKDDKYIVIQSLMKTEFQDFVSLENILQRDNFIGNLHWILAVMCRKAVDETLDDYDVEERAKEFLALDMVTVNNIAVFFYTLEKIYRLNSALSSNPKEMIEAKIAEVDMNFSKKRDGLGLLTRLQIGIIRLWYKSYVRLVRKSYISTPAKPSLIKRLKKRWKRKTKN